jgi:hypothetical protein
MLIKLRPYPGRLGDTYNSYFWICEKCYFVHIESDETLDVLSEGESLICTNCYEEFDGFEGRR